MTSELGQIRLEIRKLARADESSVLQSLLKEAALKSETRTKISRNAAKLIRQVRDTSTPGLMESFLGEYGLSTDEGIALMCLAEALLRVPDAETIDALIEDKIAPSDWGKHLGKSSSSLVNASTWALMLTGRVLEEADESLLGTLRSAVKRLGEPVIRTAVSQAMKEMGRQFVLGRTIEEAMDEAGEFEAKGFTYSYDMLGEAARTDADARRYHLSYSNAINHLASACTSEDMWENPGISVKLSALHARYEYTHKKRVMDELVPRARSLALLARSAGMGFNIDAEEADRLDLSLDVIESVLAEPALKGWDGFGVVVQAYGKRASTVIDWLYKLSQQLDRKIMVRLVKGAYWDTEIKLAQTLGVSDFPVFTRKQSTDLSYIATAKKLLSMTDRIYPQFATHNAHTVSAILELGAGKHSEFEFQRLHGMGESLHDLVMENAATRCRIYAPVGAHRDLLAYLVRRLLENGANSSFVNQIVDESISPEEIAADPVSVVEDFVDDASNPGIAKPPDIFGEQRKNSAGFDLHDPLDIQLIEKGREKFQSAKWHAGPLTAASPEPGEEIEVVNPANPDDVVGTVQLTSEPQADATIEDAEPWTGTSAKMRAGILRKAAELYEENAFELFSLLTREAGKTLLDCIGEVREAVDFLRYYANQAELLERENPRGVFVCISPWNFPLAIFTGQISAALAAGNGVIAKPAEATPLIANRAVQLLHEAGVPVRSLQLLPGEGSRIGSRLTGNEKTGGVCFTGSTATAQRIHNSMADHTSPSAPLIAETGGLNAMIVDSTALPEQATRDIIASAFQSAGQRCSALRVLYLQSEIAKPILKMLTGAMDELKVGDPADLSTDVGPVIDSIAECIISAHIDQAKQDGRLLKQLEVPDTGIFVGPALIRVQSINDLGEEIFGPVLHIATFEADEIDRVISDINASGYGLTFGLHTRIDDRVQHIVDTVEAGNIYVNRNQIGAVVGSQPFGGEGLSGTGPKAGGPNYIQRFTGTAPGGGIEISPSTDLDQKTLVQRLEKAFRNSRARFLSAQDLPGPTGESNRLYLHPRGVVLCMGPGAEDFASQKKLCETAGCPSVNLDEFTDTGSISYPDPGLFVTLAPLNAVMLYSDGEFAQKVRVALAEREGPIVPMLTSPDDAVMLTLERHVCIDTTASGGNTALLAAQS